MGLTPDARRAPHPSTGIRGRLADSAVLHVAAVSITVVAITFAVVFLPGGQATHTAAVAPTQHTANAAASGGATHSTTAAAKATPAPKVTKARHRTTPTATRHAAVHKVAHKAAPAPSTAASSGTVTSSAAPAAPSSPAPTPTYRAPTPTPTPTRGARAAGRASPARGRRLFFLNLFMELLL